MNDFNTAIMFNPKFSTAYLNRGILKIVLKDGNGACQDWKKASSLGNMQAKEFVYSNCQ